MSRAAQCYSNQPLELIVSSFGPFLLTGNSLNEIGLYVKPKSAGTKDIILNIVGMVTCYINLLSKSSSHAFM